MEQWNSDCPHTPSLTITSSQPKVTKRRTGLESPKEAEKIPYGHQNIESAQTSPNYIKALIEEDSITKLTPRSFLAQNQMKIGHGPWIVTFNISIPFKKVFFFQELSQKF